MGSREWPCPIWTWGPTPAGEPWLPHPHGLVWTTAPHPGQAAPKDLEAVVLSPPTPRPGGKTIGRRLRSGRGLSMPPSHLHPACLPAQTHGCERVPAETRVCESPHTCRFPQKWTGPRQDLAGLSHCPEPRTPVGRASLRHPFARESGPDSAPSRCWFWGPWPQGRQGPLQSGRPMWVLPGLKHIPEPPPPAHQLGAVSSGRVLAEHRCGCVEAALARVPRMQGAAAWTFAPGVWARGP